MCRVVAVILAFALAMCSAVAPAQEKSALREGFSAEALKGQKIVLFRPDVLVGEQSTGGLPEPNADWTEQARSLLEAELGRRLGEFSAVVVAEPDPSSAHASTIGAHRGLFRSVAASVLEHQLFTGNRLPTRKNKAFDWTLGEGLKPVAGELGARYGLFVSTEDQYGSTGRKVFQVIAGLGLGVGVSSGVHTGYAGLVDLTTGSLVWINADAKMGGDVREEEGMRKRVSQLLEGMPGFGR